MGRRSAEVMLSMAMVALSVSMAGGAEPPSGDGDRRMSVAIRLHDSGDYDGAIALYQGILKDDPENWEALGEMSLSHHAKGDYAAAAKAAEDSIRIEPRGGGVQYVWAGNAYDALGKLDKGEQMFRRGLAAFPNDPMLHFNLGVNLRAAGKSKDAYREFMMDVRLAPRHAGGWLALCMDANRDGRRGHALVACVRFLSLEPDTARSVGPAHELWGFLMGGVKDGGEKDGKRQIQITLSPGGAGNEAEGQAAAFALLGASRYLEEHEKKSDAEFFAEILPTAAALVAEEPNDKGGFWGPCAAAFVAAAAEAGHGMALAYDVRRRADIAEVTSWLSANADAVEKYRRWMRGYASTVCSRPN